MLSYNKITLYGQSLTDYVWIKNQVDSQTTIDSTLGYTYAPASDNNTMLLAPFTENIDGGSISSGGESLTSWVIYKNKPNDTTLTYVTTVPVTQNNIIDYNVLNNTQYLYTIYGESSSYLSVPIQAPNYVTTTWWDWSIVGMLPTTTDGLYSPDTKNIWLFDTNLTSAPLQQNLAVYTYENFTQFPKISVGEKNYISGSITAFLSNLAVASSSYSDTTTMQDTFRKFINNGDLKLLRDRKGNGWVVQTTESQMQYVDNSSEQITTVTFNFVQVDDYSNVNIVQE